MKFLKEYYEEFYFKYPTRYLSYRKNLWDKIHEYNLNLEDAGELSQIIGSRDSLLKFIDDLSLDISPEDLHLKEALKEDYKNSKYQEFCEKWNDATPIYRYSYIADELNKRYNDKDLKYYIKGLVDKIDLAQVAEEGKRLIELADYLKNFKENKNITEDIDPRTNDTDDLYAVWIPWVGKRIVDKEKMVEYLQQEIEKIKLSDDFMRKSFIGDGLAYRNIQKIVENPDTGKYEPRVPNRSDEEFFKAMHWED